MNPEPRHVHKATTPRNRQEASQPAGNKTQPRQSTFNPDETGIQVAVALLSDSDHCIALALLTMQNFVDEELP